MANIVWGNQIDVYASSTKLRNSGKLGLEINISNSKLQSTVKYTIWYWSKWAINDRHNTLYFDTDKSNATSWRRDDINIVDTTQKEHFFKLDEFTRTFNRSDRNETYTCSAKITGVEMAQGSSGHTLTVSASYTISHLDEYILTLKSNDSNNKTWSVKKAYNDSAPILNNKWSTNNRGRHIDSYNTKSNGTGSRYDVDTNYSDKITRTLYAQWKRNYLNIKYNLNGGTINDAESKYRVNKNGEVIWEANNNSVITTWEQGVPKKYGLYNIGTFSGVKVGYTFKGWSTNKNAKWNNKYYPNSDIFNEDVENYRAEYFSPEVLEDNGKTITLYAIWEETQYQIILTSGAEHHFCDKQNNIIKQNVIEYRNYFDDYINKAPISNTHSYELGYRISGWKDGNNIISNTPEISLSNTYRQGENIQLEAIWEPISYNIILKSGRDNLNLYKNKSVTKTFDTQLSPVDIVNTIEYELINEKGLYIDHTFKCWNYSIGDQNKTVNSLSDYNGNGIELTDQDIVFTAEWTELKTRVIEIIDDMKYTDGFNKYLSFDSDDDFDTLFNGKNGQPAKVPYERFHRNGYKLIGINWERIKTDVRELVKYDKFGNATEVKGSNFFDNDGYVDVLEEYDKFIGQRDINGNIIPVSANNVCKLKLIWAKEAPIKIITKVLNTIPKKLLYKDAYCYIYLPEAQRSGNRYVEEDENNKDKYKWIQVIPYIYQEDGWHKITPQDTGGNN